MHKIIVPALAAFALSAFSVPASAETVSIEVEHADLNLESEAGLATLERRIDRAVSQICGRDSKPLYRMREQQRCAAQLKASAYEQVARLARRNPSVALNR